jgi:hypothetical protein
MAGSAWEVGLASRRLDRAWRRLCRDYPDSTLTALHYWRTDPYAPHELMVRPRGKLAQRAWGTGGNKKNYEQRAFVVSPDTTAFFIVVDEIGTVVITALRSFGVRPDV